MWRIRAFYMKLRNLVWRGRAEQELTREVNAHLTLIQDEFERNGLTPEEAQLAAKRAFGGIDQAKELHRDERSFGWIDPLRQDVAHTIRLMRRRPGFTCVAVLMLGLGIGANTAMFTMLNTILFRPLPFTEPDRLVALVDEYRKTGAPELPPTVPEFLDVRAGSQSIENLAFWDTRDIQITGGDEPYRALAARVTASMFPLLGAQPILGRSFNDDENLPGNEAVMLLSHEIWQLNFGSDPSVVGRKVGLNGRPHTIIGVLPAGFAFHTISIGLSDRVEVYIPFLMNDYYTLRSGEFSNVRRVQTLGRLKPGFELAQARAEVQTIAARLVQTHPATYRDGSSGEDLGFGMDVKPLRDALVSTWERGFLILLSGAVGLVLLIACVNMAQFLLARSIERESEIAVRVAMGAGRWRLVRQLMTESLLLAAAGGVFGLLLTTWLVKFIAALLPGQGIRATDFVVDSNVLLFVALTSLFATVAFGVFPALQLSRTNPASWLTTREPSRGSNRSRHILVAAEVAMSMVLLVSAGLVIEGLRQIQTAPRGFSMDNVTVMQVRMIQPGQPIESVNYQRYLAELKALSGIESATVVSQLPMRGGAGTPFTLEGRPSDLATLSQRLADFRIISPDYFQTFQIPVLHGRAFSDSDIVGQPRVAIINEEMVRRHFPNENPLGKAIRVGNEALSVVGIVGDVQVSGLRLTRESQIYVSYLQDFEPNMFIAVRAAAGYVPPPDVIKKAIWSVMPNQAVFKIRSMNDVVSESIAIPRFTSSLLGAFSLIALVMSAIGVYTVVFYLVARRTREIAVRIATGAQRLDVLRLVAGQTFGWAAVGLILGLGGAIAASGLLRATIPGVASTSMPTLIAVAGFHVLIVALAMSLPCVRAIRLDAAAALRAE
jgi:predicted permease